MGSEMHLHRKKRANIAETQFVKSTVGLCRRYVDNSKQKHFVCNLSKHMKILQFSKQHQCPLFRSLSQRGTNIGGGAGGITWPLNETFGRIGPHVSIPKISLAQYTASICGIDNFRAHIFCPALRRLKTYLRSTMSVMKQDCVNNCLLLHCPKSITDKFNTLCIAKKLVCANEQSKRHLL